MSGVMKHPTEKKPRAPVKSCASIPTKAHRSGGALGRLKRAVHDFNSEIPYRNNIFKTGSAHDVISDLLLWWNRGVKTRNYAA
jgi:hypothetical protein